MLPRQRCTPGTGGAPQGGAVGTHRRLHACDVAPDGSHSNHRLFYALSLADPGVSASLTADPVGRAFCVGSGGRWVIAPFGEGIRVMRTPEVVHHLACGGPDCRLWSLPPGGALSTLEVTTPGMGPALSGGV
jgi:hypothetical protein